MDTDTCHYSHNLIKNHRPETDKRNIDDQRDSNSQSSQNSNDNTNMSPVSPINQDNNDTTETCKYAHKYYHNDQHRYQNLRHQLSPHHQYSPHHQKIPHQQHNLNRQHNHNHHHHNSHFNDLYQPILINDTNLNNNKIVDIGLPFQEFHPIFDHVKIEQFQPNDHKKYTLNNNYKKQIEKYLKKGKSEKIQNHLNDNINNDNSVKPLKFGVIEVPDYYPLSIPLIHLHNLKLTGYDQNSGFTTSPNTPMEGQIGSPSFDITPYKLGGYISNTPTPNKINNDITTFENFNQFDFNTDDYKQQNVPQEIIQNDPQYPINNFQIQNNNFNQYENLNQNCNNFNNKYEKNIIGINSLKHNDDQNINIHNIINDNNQINDNMKINNNFKTDNIDKAFNNNLHQEYVKLDDNMEFNNNIQKNNINEVKDNIKINDRKKFNNIFKKIKNNKVSDNKKNHEKQINKNIKVNDNIQHQNNMKFNSNNIKINDKSKVKDDIKINDNLKVHDNIKINDKNKINKNIKIYDNITEIDNKNNFNNNIKIHDNIKMEDNNTKIDNMKLNEDENNKINDNMKDNIIKDDNNKINDNMNFYENVQIDDNKKINDVIKLNDNVTKIDDKNNFNNNMKNNNIKIDNNNNINNNMKLNEEIKLDDSNKINDNMKLNDNIKIDNENKLNDNNICNDNNKIVDNNKINDSKKQHENIKIDNKNKINDNMKIHDNIKTDDNNNINQNIQNNDNITKKNDKNQFIDNMKTHDIIKKDENNKINDNIKLNDKIILDNKLNQNKKLNDNIIIDDQNKLNENKQFNDDIKIIENNQKNDSKKQIENIKIDDKNKINDNMKIHDSIKKDDMNKINDGIQNIDIITKIDDKNNFNNKKDKDNIKIDDNNNNNTQLNDKIKLDDNNKINDNTKLNDNIKIDDKNNLKDKAIIDDNNKINIEIKINDNQDLNKNTGEDNKINELKVNENNEFNHIDKALDIKIKESIKMDDNNKKNDNIIINILKVDDDNDEKEEKLDIKNIQSVYINIDALENNDNINKIENNDNINKTDNNKDKEDEQNKNKQYLDSVKPPIYMNSTLSLSISPFSTALIKAQRPRLDQKYQAALKMCTQTGQQFVDIEFPANEKSLADPQDLIEYRNVEKWLRPKEIWETDDFELYYRVIEPNDVQQGYLGDCAFLSAIAAIAENPERIQKSFINQEKSKYGLYGLNVVWRGVPTEILIDDFFPVDFQNKPIFQQAKEKELWAFLMEKAWAKLHGNYHQLNGQLVKETLHDFTGAPVRNFDPRKADENKLWEKILNAKRPEVNRIVCAGTIGEDTGDDTDPLKRYGLVSGHAYSVVGAYELNLNSGKRQRLVKIRNPWGNFEWNQSFADTDRVWEQISENDKVMMEYKNEDDGTFFMKWETLRGYFDSLDICYYFDKYNYFGLKCHSQFSEAKFFKVEIKKEAYAFFFVSQLSIRVFDEDYQFEHPRDCGHYSETKLCVSDSEGNILQKLKGKKRDIYSPKYVDDENRKKYKPVNWQNKAAHSFGIGCYTEEADVKEISKSEANCLNPFVDKWLENEYFDNEIEMVYGRV